MYENVCIIALFDPFGIKLEFFLNSRKLLSSPSPKPQPKTKKVPKRRKEKKDLDSGMTL